jgi:hypothetical protein
MIYITSEPYNDDYTYEDNNINPNYINAHEECFVCYEFFDKKNMYTIKLRNKTNYFRLCACDGWIHETCLDYWCSEYDKCPICRDIMIKKQKHFLLFIINNQLNNSYINFCFVVLYKNFNLFYFLFLLILYSFIFIDIICIIYIICSIGLLDIKDDYYDDYFTHQDLPTNNNLHTYNNYNYIRQVNIINDILLNNLTRLHHIVPYDQLFRNNT